MFGDEPALAARHGHVDGAVEHDSDDGGEGVSREGLRFCKKVASGVVDQDIERTFRPDLLNYLFDVFVIAHVASEGLTFSARRAGKVFGGLFDDFGAASADVAACTKLQEALGQRAADAGAAAGHEKASILQEIAGKHECPF